MFINQYTIKPLMFGLAAVIIANTYTLKMVE